MIIKNHYLADILEKMNRNKGLIKMLAVFAVIFFIIFITIEILALPRQFSEYETEINGKNFEITVSQTGTYKNQFDNTIQILKKYPYFYKKVVNNIDSIQINNKCPLMCVSFNYNYESWLDLIIIPPNKNKIPLSINPSSTNTYNDDYKFTSALIHEADHIEFLRSSKIKKIARMIKCNPITNFRISIDSNLSSITHRISATEICAEKEQIKFHKATKTESGYEIKNGILYNFGRAVIDAVKFFFSFITFIF